MQERQAQCHKRQRESSYEHQHVGIHLFRVIARLIGKAEKTRFHPEGKEYQNERRIGIYVRNDTIPSGSRRQHRRIKRDQQIIQEASDDTAHTIDGSILCQRF